MKFATMAIVCVVFTASSAITEGNAKAVELSDSAKLKLRRGIVKYLNTMCAGDAIESEVVKKICSPAATLEINTYSRCSSCDAYVDPMCMLDCPQFFDNKMDLYSRCSTCDAYVDPMCMLDCPQFFDNKMDLYSRCSTCDAYVDPMCMLDCPQFFDNKVDIGA